MQIDISLKSIKKCTQDFSKFFRKRDFIIFSFFFMKSSYFMFFSISGAHTLANQNQKLIVNIAVILLKQSESVSAKIAAMKKGVIFPISFCDYLSYLTYGFLFTQRIARHFTYILTWAKYECIRKNYGELIWIQEFWVMIKSVMRFYEFVELLEGSH